MNTGDAARVSALMRAVPEYHLSDAEAPERFGADLTDLPRSKRLA